MAKVLAALLLLLAVVGPACALTQPGNRVENAAALERFRNEFPRVSGGQTLAASDRAYRLFAEVMRRVQTEHVRPQPPMVMVEKALAGVETKYKADRNAGSFVLTEAGLDAMLTALDPYSSYLDAENFRYMREQTQGEFGGLGIEVTMDEESGLVKVVSPIDGSPAARAGLRSGDLIARIDEQAVKGMNLRDAVAKMRGPVGSHVALSLKRGAGAACRSRFEPPRRVAATGARQFRRPCGGPGWRHRPRPAVPGPGSTVPAHRWAWR